MYCEQEMTEVKQQAYTLLVGCHFILFHQLVWLLMCGLKM